MGTDWLFAFIYYALFSFVFANPLPFDPVITHGVLLAKLSLEGKM